MAAIFMRDFPEKLHREAKIRAAQEGITLKELFAKAIHLYIHGSSKPGKAITEDDLELRDN
jgi:predicted HicB family RNase H-like nuclease